MTELTISNAFVIVALGLMATGIMALVLYAARWLKLVELDIIGTMGSIFTRSRSKYTSVGWTVHLTVGILFAFLYVAVWNLLDIDKPMLFTLLGGALGAAHGLMVSFFLVVFVAEHHRLRRMRGSVGYGAAVVQWGAHVVYGVALGFGAAVYFWYISL